AAVPGGDTIKESYAPLVRAIIQPLGVILDLISLAREMSQSFFDLYAPASQPGSVGRVNGLHRSGLLQLLENPLNDFPNHQHGWSFGGGSNPISALARCYRAAPLETAPRKKNAIKADISVDA